MRKKNATDKIPLVHHETMISEDDVKAIADNLSMVKWPRFVKIITFCAFGVGTAAAVFGALRDIYPLLLAGLFAAIAPGLVMNFASRPAYKAYLEHWKETGEDWWYDLKLKKFTWQPEQIKEGNDGKAS